MVFSVMNFHYLDFHANADALTASASAVVRPNLSFFLSTVDMLILISLMVTNGGFGLVFNSCNTWLTVSTSELQRLDSSPLNSRDRDTEVSTGKYQPYVTLTRSDFVSQQHPVFWGSVLRFSPFFQEYSSIPKLETRKLARNIVFGKYFVLQNSNFGF